MNEWMVGGISWIDSATIFFFFHLCNSDMLSVVSNYLNVVTFLNGLLCVLMVFGHELVHEAWTYMSFPQHLLLDSNNYVNIHTTVCRSSWFRSIIHIIEWHQISVPNASFAIGSASFFQILFSGPLSFLFGFLWQQKSSFSFSTTCLESR